MYNFIFNMYRMGRIGETETNAFAEKGFITQEQAEQIMAISEE